MTVDRSLVRLVLVIAWLNGVHTLDHIIRGDFHWPLDGRSVGFVLIVAAIYLVIGIGLRWSRRGAVGPLFWAVIGCGGLVFGWLSHFSPFTDQPLHVIYGSYHNATGGSLAVLSLMLLMAVVLTATLYSFYLWHRQRHFTLSRPVSRSPRSRTFHRFPSGPISVIFLSIPPLHGIVT